MNFFAFSMLIPLFPLKILVFSAFTAFKDAVFIFILLRLLRSALVWFFILFAIILFFVAIRCDANVFALVLAAIAAAIA